MFRNLRPSTARAVAAAVVPVGVLLGVTLPAAAQIAPATSYPNRPVRFVVPFPPAGNTDVVARTIGQKLAELWGQQVVNIRLLHVPYKGTGPAFNDLLSGQVNLQVTGVATVQGHLRTGRLKLLGVGGDKRMAAYPDVPTVDESGFPGYRAGTWFGVVTPAGLAQPLVERLHRDIVRVMGYPDVRERMAGLGFDILTQSPEEFGRFIREDTQRWAKVARESGARVD